MRFERVVAIGAILSVAAGLAEAGELTDEAHQISVTYDDVEWASASGTWPLECTNIQCTAVACSISNNGSGDTDVEAVALAIAIEEDMVATTDDQIVKPEIRRFGETSGVLWINRYDYGDFIVVEHAFSVLTRGPAKRVILSCTGETVGGEPITVLFEKLLAGVKLF